MEAAREVPSSPIALSSPPQSPRDRKVENFPDSSIYRAKTFRTGKKCVNQIFAIKMCVNHNFAPKGWFNSRFICLSIWKPATKLSDSMF